MGEIEGDESMTKRICYRCIHESYLAAEIRSSGQEAICDYRGARASSIDIDALEERIEQAFADHYTRTSDQPDSWQERLMADRESNYDWDREGMPVNEAVQEAVGIDQEPPHPAESATDQYPRFSKQRANLAEHHGQTTASGREQPT